MRPNAEILSQIKTHPPRLWLAILVIFSALALAGLAYSRGGLASDERMVLIPLSSLTPAPGPAPTSLASAAEKQGASLTALEPGAEAPALSPNAFHLSLAKNSAQTIGSANEVQDEDILSYDGTDFALVFDGSAAGLADKVDIDAFDFMDADTILISFDKAISIGPLQVDDSDIVKFEATSLGLNNTAGTFSLFFDGSAVGLTTGSENVDAFTLLPDGTLLVSTEGRAKVPGANRNIRADKEDILTFTPATSNDYSNGAWSLYLDGTNVGIRGSNENIDGLAIGPDGELYLTTTGKFSVNDIAGRGDDIFIYYTSTSLEASLVSNFSPTLFFDGSLQGLNRNDVDAISVP